MNPNKRNNNASRSLFFTTLIVTSLIGSVYSFQASHHPQPLTRARIPSSSRSSTSMELRRSFRKILRNKQVVNQSTYVWGPPHHDDIKYQISSKRLRVEEKLLQRRLKLQAKQQQQASNNKSATVFSSTMNLIKVVLGSGVLALPSGLAAMSDYPIALLPASGLMLVLGILSAYSFQLYGRLTHDTQATNMGEIWERTKGKESSWIISASTLSFCFGVCVAFSLVIGDFMSSLALSMGSGVPAMFAKRQFWILSVTLSTLLPLCNLKSLAALAPMSVVGTFGTILTTLFMAWRCPAIFPGSPYAAMGKYALAVAPALAPKFNTFSKVMSPAALIIAAMSTTAYLGHFNAPEFYNGFKSQSSKTTNGHSTNSTEHELARSSLMDAAEVGERDTAMKKYGKMTGIGFAGVTAINILIMAFGFLTFGGNCAGVVLNNYATTDRGAVISRLLMTLSVIGGYPFMVGGCKSAFVQLYNDVKGKVESKAKLEKWVVRTLLAMSTSIALAIRNAGLVVSLNGAIMGSAIIYVYPAIMFLSHTKTQLQNGAISLTRRLKVERWMSRLLVTFGVFSGLIGAAVSIINASAPHLLR